MKAMNSNLPASESKSFLAFKHPGLQAVSHFPTDFEL
jgi:hypothetical protein